MEDEKSSKALGVFIFIAIVIFFVGLNDISKLEDENAQLYEKNERLLDENEELEQKVEDYADALFEANNNIESLNEQIDNTRSYAWTTYEEMGSAIDDLHTLRIIDTP